MPSWVLLIWIIVLAPEPNGVLRQEDRGQFSIRGFESRAECEEYWRELLQNKRPETRADHVCIKATEI